MVNSSAVGSANFVLFNRWSPVYLFPNEMEGFIEKGVRTMIGPTGPANALRILKMLFLPISSPERHNLD